MTIYRFVRRFGVVVAGLGFAAAAQAAGADLQTREMCKEALPQVAKEFAGLLAPVRREGFCLAGDFSGDGSPDVIMVVKVLVTKLPASANVKTIYPFSDKEGEKGRLQFLALHTRKGLAKDGSLRSDKLLLDGGSPIMVLRHENIESDMERITPRSPEVEGLQLPRGALRGDGVYLGTEAVSAILYWNGKTYVLHEDPAGP